MAVASQDAAAWPSFLAHFAPSYPADVCYDELDALLGMHGIHSRSSFPRVPLDIINNPFLVIRLPSFDVATSIAKRSALLVDVTELWMTHNCETLHDTIASASAPTWRAKAAELFAVRLWS